MGNLDQIVMFGALAYKLGFATRDQVCQAIEAWRADKSKSLGDILLKLGALDERQRGMLDDLVVEQLRVHASTRGKDLAALSFANALQVVLAEVSDDELATSALAESQSFFSVAATVASADRDAARSVPDESRRGHRFEVRGLIDEGGLGKVFEAHDSELHRTVALKEIKEEFADHQSSRKRFLLEAEITGGLEHPGIVPVYGLGHDDRGRPYYAMRLIKGKNLREKIREFHETDWTRRNPGDRSVAIRRLLGSFVDVCNAMRYAHKRGILHRDLKPRNIMLGEYGETLVVDWGLAKAMGKRAEGTTDDHDAEDTLHPEFGSSIDRTVGAVGSPAYMSPEQASGQTDEMGPATDIYGLGATLYTILTNRPPFEAAGREAILQKVARGDFSPLQTDVLVQRPLVSVCLKAMALRPADRYETVDQLAHDVEQFLADGRVSAHSYSWLERVSRIGRRHRTLVRASVGALVCFSALTAASAIVIKRQRDVVSVQRDTIQAALNSAQSESDRAQAERDWAEAVSSLLFKIVGSADPDVEGRKVMVTDVLELTRKELEAEREYDPMKRAQLWLATGLTYQGLGAFDESLRCNELGFEILSEELGANSEAALAAMNRVAELLYYSGQIQRSMSMFLELLHLAKSSLEADHEIILAAVNGLATCHSQLGEHSKALDMHRQNLVRISRALGSDHINALMAMNNVAMVLREMGEHEEAITLLEDVIKRGQQQLSDDHTSMLLWQQNLSAWYYSTKQYEKAIQMSSLVVDRSKERLGDAHPDTIRRLIHLAQAHLANSEFGESVRILSDVLRIQRDAHGDTASATQASVHSLGMAYIHDDQYDEAIALYGRTLAQLRAPQVSEDDKRILNMRHLVAQTHGLAGRPDLALKMHLDVVEDTRSAYGDDDRDTRILLNYMSDDLNQLKSPPSVATQARIDNLYQAMGQFVEAEAVARSWLAAVEPNNTAEMSRALTSLATALLGQEDAESAAEHAQKALEFTGDDPEMDVVAARARNVLGAALAAKGKFDEAEDLLIDSYRELESQLSTIPSGTRWLVVRACERVIDLYRTWDRPEELANWQADLARLRAKIGSLKSERSLEDTGESG